jgi:ribosomal protein L29
MELKELKKKDKGDLHRILAESRDKLRDLRFKDANKQLKDVREIRKVRQTIARISTLLNSNNSKQKIVNSKK